MTILIVEEGRTFIRTLGSGVFKLGILGLTLSGSENSFFEFGTSGFRVFKLGISGLILPVSGNSFSEFRDVGI